MVHSKGKRWPWEAHQENCSDGCEKILSLNAVCMSERLTCLRGVLCCVVLRSAVVGVNSVRMGTGGLLGVCVGGKNLMSATDCIPVPPVRWIDDLGSTFLQSQSACLSSFSSIEEAGTGMPPTIVPTY